MATPASWENTLRIHDDALFRWLGKLRVDYGGPSDFPATFPFAASYPTRNNFPILRTMATRQRAWASVLDLLVGMRWIDSGTAEQIRASAGDFAVLPLPVCVYERGDPEIIEEHARDELGMVYPGELVIRVQGSPDDAAAATPTPAATPAVAREATP